MCVYDKYVGLALDLGFSYAVPIQDFALVCEPELRAYCNAEQCGNYGSTWVCPPGCGSITECQAHASKYRSGIVLQTVSSIPGFEKTAELHVLQVEHNTRFLNLADMARRNGANILPLTTGGCLVCEFCTFPGVPCCEPERRMHSLSAYGINVGMLCERAELEYSFRPDMVYFTAYLGFSC